MSLFIFLLCSVFKLFSQNAQTKPDALVEYRTGNYEKAVSICREELAANANNIDTYVVISWSLVRLGRYEEAGTYALAGLNISRYDPRIIEVLGETSYYQGKNQDALRYFQEYINYAPEGGRIDQVYFFMGELYIRLGKFLSADIALSTAVHWQPNNAEWLTRLAYARESAGDYAHAVSAYEKALLINPQLTDARRGFERARKSLGAR
ncbi:MAG: tetratricopeptide repeat protein [Treponema sp.]|jgi:tetratricopeptide (TPR) repeat protein|nr:tetratricopeptide repeat protein [Treponema sp.]